MADEWWVRRLILKADIVAAKTPSMIRGVEAIFEGQYTPD